MSIHQQSAVHVAYAEQAAIRDADLEQARAEIRHLRTRLAIAERVARRLHDRDAASRAWAERLEREAFLLVPEQRYESEPSMRPPVSGWGR